MANVLTQDAPTYYTIPGSNSAPTTLLTPTLFAILATDLKAKPKLNGKHTAIINTTLRYGITNQVGL